MSFSIGKLTVLLKKLSNCKSIFFVKSDIASHGRIGSDKCRTLLENLQCDSKIVGARPNLAPISHDASSLLLTISYGHEVFQFSFDYTLVETLLG